MNIKTNSAQMSDVVRSLSELPRDCLQQAHHPLLAVQPTPGLLINHNIVLHFPLQLVVHFLVLCDLFEHDIDVFVDHPMFC
jgi:hypothetical protein